MKKIIIKAIAFVTVGIMFLFNMHAAACTRFNSSPPNKMVSGVSGTKYYIDTYSIPSEYQTFIVEAANQWSSRSTMIELVRDTTGLYSKIDFYATTNPGGALDNAYGWTYYKVTGGSQVSPRSSSWNYAVIGLNLTSLESSELTDYQRISTMGHEIGHAFGLTECIHGNTSHIMYQQSNLRTAMCPSTTDIIAVEYIYSN